jgi:hypothetical protein
VRARDLQDENRPIKNILGKEAPVKVPLSKNFADKKKREENIKGMK